MGSHEIDVVVLYATEFLNIGLMMAFWGRNYRGADKSLTRPGRKQATEKEDFEFHISYL